MNMYLPIAIIVLSNIFYHISSKATPDEISPFASMAVTYAVGAALSVALYFLFNRGGNLLTEFRQLNWSAWLLGMSIVGLEVGAIYMYKVGWDISVGQIICSAALSICLAVIGLAVHHETFTVSKLIGMVICMVGLYFINK